MDSSTGMFGRSPSNNKKSQVQSNGKKKESGMIGNFPVAKDYFKEVHEDEI